MNAERDIFIVQCLVVTANWDTTSGKLLSGQLNGRRSVIIFLGNFLVLLLSNDFDVGRGGHVGCLIAKEK